MDRIIDYIEVLLSDQGLMEERMAKREARLRAEEVRQARLAKEQERWASCKAERDRNAMRLRVKFHG